MGARRSIEERSQKKRRALHVWVYPTKASLRPHQGLIVATRKDPVEGWVAQIVYVEDEDLTHPNFRSGWFFPHQFAVVPNQPGEPPF